MSPVSLLVVDDHALVRQGLCQLLLRHRAKAQIRRTDTAQVAVDENHSRGVQQTHRIGGASVETAGRREIDHR